uniref:Cyclin-dependent kinase inhibitor domain-containing protein n=1 Tax=Populus alba TaxID=43335 RepID=A0A4U5QML6_POPAL|nr:hypothetical protein D5086_0000066300 [Populus alba]
MGKYMKKSKITSDVVAVMEVTSGVRTRAKTHALQLLQSPVSSNLDATSTCYLQLRSRRLEKPAPLFNAETKRNTTKEKDTFSCKGASRLRVNSSSTTGGCDEKGTGKLGFKCETEDSGSLKEASSGDNCFDFERCTRESTPCSLIRDSETIANPGSTTRQRSSTAGSQRLLNTQRNIPTTCEMDEFFAGVEQQQQRLFIEKYNFDIVNDLPLSGRYEWVRDSERSDLHRLALYNLIIYLPCKLMLSEWKPWKMFNSKICNTTELIRLFVPYLPWPHTRCARGGGGGGGGGVVVQSEFGLAG